ncbi:hypothetical protein OG607_15490 [Streptomyces sp. NBC_01537]|uniref:hypothetical protein n=1 Tax=unclassified Streptomyces TaxID=2593676 RepID=UPI002E354C8E|nr:hypothetical protein [Streptomyces sp. NBC_01262]
MSDDIETFENAFDSDDTEDDAELDLEAPEADAADQHIELLQHRDVPITERPDDADPADAADQRRVVELDEDDYR